jgi:hypothetical protein
VTDANQALFKDISVERGLGNSIVKHFVAPIPASFRVASLAFRVGQDSLSNLRLGS